MKFMKKITRGILFAIISVTIAGCTKKAEEPPIVVNIKDRQVVTLPEFAEEEKEEEPEDLTGKAMNPLTGNYINEDLAKRRPEAIVFNNISFALPQSGISQADMYYEVLAEAGITRIIALAQRYTSERIGSIRSARHYFLYFTLDNDAIFIHHGGSDKAYSFISKNNIKDINGDFYDGIYFYRDQKKAQTASREHTSFTKGYLLDEAINSLKIPRYHDESFTPMFDFFPDDTEILYSENATRLILDFSDTQQSVFMYDETDGLYYRYQNGEKQIDEETGKQLAVKNVIVQMAGMEIIDEEGRRDVSLIGEGEGYLLTGGKYAPITWKKDSAQEQTKWYDKSGDDLKINKGKTWICVYDKFSEVSID